MNLFNKLTIWWRRETRIYTQVPNRGPNTAQGSTESNLSVGSKEGFMERASKLKP